ncbi:ImmA/IrrE family metallo-endopeptidase [Listeria valentina]|uniref:ImmA/IrrE family metallo-endopeptidase n=1 Tax=Listeria valentina TaxID=2705293 RepID=UPI00142FA9DE|nr:ImmA/IrrE family metallo-endopeptidase [Listeria valentina]
MEPREVARSVSSKFLIKNKIAPHGYLVENVFREIFYTYNIDYIYRKFNKKRLGVIVKDELGVSIGINNLFPFKKVFSTGHEVGHFFMDLPNCQIGTFSDDNKTTNIDTKNLQVETRANIFASHLICPEDVLEYYLNEGTNFFEIANCLRMSYESLKWRIVDYIKTHYSLYYNQILKLVEDFIACSKKQRHKDSMLYTKLLELDYSIHGYNKKLLEQWT